MKESFWKSFLSVIRTASRKYFRNVFGMSHVQSVFYKKIPTFRHLLKSFWRLGKPDFSKWQYVNTFWDSTMFHLTCLTLLLNTREQKVHEVSEHSNYTGLEINWCWCGICCAIFACLPSGVWWSQHSKEHNEIHP